MTSSTDMQRGLGLAAAVPAEVIDGAAAAVAGSGYASFWLNNPPGASALAALGRVGAQVQGMHLGVGVIPLSAQGPDQIVQDARQHNVPLNRFYLGIGSGSGPGGVDRVAAGITALRGELDTAIVIAALGPRMCRLGGAQADGVLLNWLTPDFARTSVQWIREAAQGAGRPVPRIMAYVRTAIGEGAIARLQKEAGNYESSPHYAAHFKRMGVGATGTAVTGTSPEEIQRGLAAWDGVVDEVVIRAITASDTLKDVMELVEAATRR